METVERSVLINASRQRVWEAVTDFDQVVKWFMPNLPWAQMVRDDSGKIAVHMGPMAIDFATLEAVNAPSRVTVRSLPDRLIATAYTLEEENGGTCVKVKMSGFESLTEEARQARVSLSSEGWDKALNNLKAFVDGADLPHPQAFVGPLFGYWRESKKTLAVERSIWINVPRERAWKAVTDPKQIQMWMSPTTEWQLSALEVGGRFYVRNEENSGEMYVEVIELLDPPHQLVTRTVPDTPEQVVKGKTYTLKEENGGTRLIVTLAGYEQEPEATRWNTMEENAVGFGMMLQNTKAYLEGEDLPFPGGF